jgi:hypothetical protein
MFPLLSNDHEAGRRIRRNNSVKYYGNSIHISLDVRTVALFLVLIASAPLLPAAQSQLPVPNRGKQLFVVIRGRPSGDVIVAMAPDRRPLIREWNRDNPTYDFISAVVRHKRDGCRVTFTRYVMREDYVPRIERLELSFPYSQQPLYRFFDDHVYIIGFYRRSPRDIDRNEVVPGPHT